MRISNRVRQESRRRTESYGYERESHKHTGMERMKELISLINSGSTCFEGAVLGKGVRAAITREEHVTTRWP